MIPYSYNIVNLDGIDLTDVKGKTFDGIYDNILQAMNSCGVVILSNWKCAGVYIPPSYVNIVLDSGSIIINNTIIVHDNDTIEIPSMGTQPVIETLNIEENGIYLAPSGVDGFSPVVVTIPTGIPYMNKSVWDSLTTEEKREFGLVGIINSTTGYNRGLVVNGSDYVPLGIYIPYSDSEKIICESYTANFDSTSEYWGNGNTPIAFTGNGAEYSTSEHAVYLPLNSLGIIAYVSLGAPNTVFTCYLVIKLINPTTYSRVIGTMNTRAQRQGFACYGNPFVFSTWGNAINTGISTTSDYVVVAIKYDGTSVGKGYIYGYNQIMEQTISNCGANIAIARSDANPDTNNAEPCDCYVKYFAVVKDADSDANIINNVNNLQSAFVS